MLWKGGYIPSSHPADSFMMPCSNADSSARYTRILVSCALQWVFILIDPVCAGQQITLVKYSNERQLRLATTTLLYAPWEDPSLDRVSCTYLRYSGFLVRSGYTGAARRASRRRAARTASVTASRLDCNRAAVGPGFKWDPTHPSTASGLPLDCGGSRTRAVQGPGGRDAPRVMLQRRRAGQGIARMRCEKRGRSPSRKRGIALLRGFHRLVNDKPPSLWMDNNFVSLVSVLPRRGAQGAVRFRYYHGALGLPTSCMTLGPSMGLVCLWT